MLGLLGEGVEISESVKLGIKQKEEDKESSGRDWVGRACKI